MDVSSRIKFVDDLDSFIEEKSKLFSDILSKLDWNAESLLADEKVQCPFDKGHWIPEAKLKDHTAICSWLKNGYLKEDVEKDLSSHGCKQEFNNNSIIIDKQTQVDVLMEKGLLANKPLEEVPDVPLTYDRCTVDWNPEQRLAFYDHVVKVNRSKSGPASLTLEDLMLDFENKDGFGDRPKTQLEILAEARDYKRRRQSYRAKNVHITKKSYTEIMKEVIDNQITMLTDMRKQESNENGHEDMEPSTSTRRDRSETPQSLSPSSCRRKRRPSRDSSRSRSRSPHKNKKHKRERNNQTSRDSSRSRSRSPHKKKKHKRDRSRSRKHKKHHKHKKSKGSDF